MQIKYNHKNIKKINSKVQMALVDTTKAIKTDLMQSQLMPFDTGTMQNDSTFVDDKQVKKGITKIVVDTPYARKVYFDPEIDISTKENSNARQYYFEDYIVGSKKELPFTFLEKSIKRRMTDG